MKENMTWSSWFKPMLWTLVLLFHLPILAQTTSTSQHPALYVSTEDRGVIQQKIESEDWAKASWDKLLQEVEPFANRHQTDPDWIVSRLAMYWQDGEHYTQCYIKNQDWDYGEGNAPVPTVRLPGMRRWNDYYNVPLAERTPYNATGDMWGVSRSSGDTTRILVPYKESGHMIRQNNMEILKLAEKSAFAYYLTQDEKYAKFSSDILWAWLLGTYYMEPPLDPEESSNGPGGYAPGGILGYYDYEVIHDDRQEPAAFTYDFVRDYMSAHPHEHLQTLDMTVTDLAGVVFKRFIEIGLVRGGDKGNWNVNRYRHIIPSMLVLESDDYYADGKGKEHYIPYYTEISTEYHAALPKILQNYDPDTGLWPESPGYASGMIGAILQMAMPLYKAGVNTVGDNPIIQKAAMANIGWLDPRGNLVVFGDMRGGPLGFDVFERLLTYYSWVGSDEYVAKVETVINKGIEMGQYDRADGEWRSIVLNQPIQSNQTTLPYHGAAYSRFHRHMILRNGNDEDNGLMFTLYGGKKGGHLSPNGLAWQFYHQGWAMAPDASAYESYWSKDAGYHRNIVGSNTIIQGYQKGDITVNAMSPVVPEGQFYNDEVISKYCSFADVSADEKRRVIAMIRTSPTSGYYVDIFRSDLEDNDYLHHNLGDKLTLQNVSGEPLVLTDAEIANPPHKAYSFFEQTKAVAHEGDFKATWTIDRVSPSISTTMWMTGGAGRTLYQMDAPPTTLRADVTPGQVNKAPQNTPTLLVQQYGSNGAAHPFVAVFDSYAGDQSSVKQVETKAASATFVQLEVTSAMSEQTIYQATDDQVYEGGKKQQFQGRLGVVSQKDGELEYLFLGQGKQLQFGKYEIEAVSEPATVELRWQDGQLYYSADQPIRIKLKKGKTKEYPAGYDLLID
ncbi:hypothetical protein [Reichenbachiella agariperforans]|uniref:hypothetical protein n=1 Tax=Reichenbachiella agariperforans TaxID=156994 RepID=UPI001C0A17D6|nr:hypothetical protein [Reichenbachiella agariperforans]MBU2914128.1 hypothetical protein [Reichenbachiella agariperforans]